MVAKLTRPWKARFGDRVRLDAKVIGVKIVPVKVGSTETRRMLTVEIEDCCKAGIAEDRVAEVVSEDIRAGDRVRFRSDEIGTYVSEPWCFGTVLHVEDAKSATGLSDPDPGQARALVKPDSYSGRPLIRVNDLQRVGHDDREQ